MATEKAPAGDSAPSKPPPPSQQQQQAQSPPAEPKPAKTGNRNLMTIIVVGALMLAEGAGLFFAFKMMGAGPAKTQASETIEEGIAKPLVDEQGKVIPTEAEIPVVTDLVSLNSVSGIVYVYRISVYVKVDTKNQKAIEECFKNNQFTIRDTLSRVVRGADPKYMDEADLSTMRRLFKTNLDEITKDESFVKSVIIADFSKSRGD